MVIPFISDECDFFSFSQVFCSSFGWFIFVILPFHKIACVADSGGGAVNHLNCVAKAMHIRFIRCLELVVSFADSHTIGIGEEESEEK